MTTDDATAADEFHAFVLEMEALERLGLNPLRLTPEEVEDDRADDRAFAHAATQGARS